jgi:hypothetical protein
VNLLVLLLADQHCLHPPLVQLLLTFLGNRGALFAGACGFYHPKHVSAVMKSAGLPILEGYERLFSLKWVKLRGFANGHVHPIRGIGDQTCTKTAQ